MIAARNKDAITTLVGVQPQDLIAEKNLLACILESAEAYDDAVQTVTAESFYGDANRLIFSAIAALYEKRSSGVDVVTLAHAIRDRGHWEEIGGQEYYTDVFTVPAIAGHASYYAEIVRDKWLLRRLLEASKESIRDVHSGDEPGEILSRAERRVFDVLEATATVEGGGMEDILEATFERIFHRMDKSADSTGLKSGIGNLDEVTCGFQPSELVVLAARPSMGKTALVCNLALAFAEAGKGVLFFSLEQSRLELAERMLCINAKIDGHKLRKGELDEFEQSELMEASVRMKRLPIVLDDKAGRTVSQIAAISRRQKRRGKLAVVIIDYLQLVESEDSRLPREQQISSITRRLKCLAKDLAVPVVALSQLNRGVEQRNDKVPKLGDLRESGAIEQDADVVMLLHRPEAYEPEDRPGEADIIVAKNRNGPIGKVELVWLKEMMQFRDKYQGHARENY